MCNALVVADLGRQCTSTRTTSCHNGGRGMQVQVIPVGLQHRPFRYLYPCASPRTAKRFNDFPRPVHSLSRYCCAPVSRPTMAPDLLPTYGPFDVKSATVLITGGSSGIGLGLAEQFLKAGSNVIVTGRRESVLKEAQAKHPKLHVHVNDVAQAVDREELSRWVVKAFPDVNVLVNNAGIMRRGALAQESEDWSVRQSEIAINIEAPVHLMQLLTPHFLKQKEAAIVNLSSGLAFVPPGFAPVYGGTKAFIHQFTLASRFHYAKTKVRVVEINPPAVKTNLGGGHDIGEDCDVFCEHVFKRFVAGEAEVGFNNSETWRLAPRSDNEKTSMMMWDRVSQNLPVFEAEH